MTPSNNTNGKAVLLRDGEAHHRRGLRRQATDGDVVAASGGLAVACRDRAGVANLVDIDVVVVGESGDGEGRLATGRCLGPGLVPLKVSSACLTRNMSVSEWEE